MKNNMGDKKNTNLVYYGLIANFITFICLSHFNICSTLNFLHTKVTFDFPYKDPSRNLITVLITVQLNSFIFYKLRNK